MSAGEFIIANYQTTELGQQIMPIRIQPKTAQLFIAGTANAGSTSAITLSLRVRVNGGNSEYGVKPRKVTVRFTDETDLPDGYSGDDLTVPILTQAAYDAYLVGSTGTYLGSPVQVVSRKPELIH